jgi:hypothetical protein
MDGRGKSRFVLYTKLYLITIFNQSLDSAYSVYTEQALNKRCNKD